MASKESISLIFLLFSILLNSLVCEHKNETTLIIVNNNNNQNEEHSALVPKSLLLIDENSTSQSYDISRFKSKTTPTRNNSLAELADRLRREKGVDGQVDEEGKIQTVNYDKYARVLVNTGQSLPDSNIKWKQLISAYNCDFESDCKWSWRRDIAHGFFITAGGNLKNGETGPKFDANKREFGSYLILHISMKTPITITSPLIPPTTSNCKLKFFMYQENVVGTEIRIVGDKLTYTKKIQSLGNHTQWLFHVIEGKEFEDWKEYSLTIGKISTNFTILIEVMPTEDIVSNATIGFDNLQLYECFAQNERNCSKQQYRCKNSKECIDITRVCDFQNDCHLGDDERQNCNAMPNGSRSTFEDPFLYGWTNSQYHTWVKHNGSTPMNFSVPHFDHTYMNSSGNYMLAILGTQFASRAGLYSMIFNPPPKAHGNKTSKYYKSCAIRFYLYKTGSHKTALSLKVIEMLPNENRTTRLYWNFLDDHGQQWRREVCILPNITNRYFFYFEAKQGFRYLTGTAIDDISLTPECFGINIPEKELQGYDYWNPSFETFQQTVPEFQNELYYELTTCNAKGRFGPTQKDCDSAYKKANVRTQVLTEFSYKGMQKWLAPASNFYTIIVAGAGGGKGSPGMGSSRGAIVTMVLYLEMNSGLYMAVGQKGTNACLKIHSQPNNCTTHIKRHPAIVQDLLSYHINDSGGGGGGGTYVFYKNESGHRIPLIIAGGGGGLGLSPLVDDTKHHGQGINYKMPPFAGNMTDMRSAGAGGGWAMFPGDINPLYISTMGSPLLYGGVGGKACYNSSHNYGDGGFGGGGGGCKNGGGGGGFAGGNANTSNGDGGVSFVNPYLDIRQYSKSVIGQNGGDGYVIIIPAIDGCNCQHRCVALDKTRSVTACVCPEGWRLSTDGYSCIPLQLDSTPPYPLWFTVIVLFSVVLVTVAVAMLCFLLYTRYQYRVNGLWGGRKPQRHPELQLGRLQRNGNLQSQYNPNYQFGGVIITVSDLVHIPRDDIRLIKPLGQGAFGEVYQGYYSKQQDGELIDLQVAVKTLQEPATKQGEDDFITEALIMSKFDHTNIVKFMGVCFDRHPKFIVLELLHGGDLKNFLRESRPKPNCPSLINMKDLLTIAIDIARGCRYLEEKHFIHRDIAARNCLLTTRHSGRIAKIADFGMSRDVYRADYYRKDGKAMLPIKWMPPEAFLEGIFSSKTDVWSFGILMWEIMKMGFMPYTGCTNKEVMDLVINGGRLVKPDNCPEPVFAIMSSCWHPQPEQRPNFATIMERLGYCIQDPDILSAPLPMVYPDDKDATPVIRPRDPDANCLQVLPNASNYLVPSHTSSDAMIPNDSSTRPLMNSTDSHLWSGAIFVSHSNSSQPLLDNSNKDEENNHSKIDIMENGTANNNFIMKNDTSIQSGVALDVKALLPESNDTDSTKKISKTYISLADTVTQNGNCAV